MHAIEIFYSEEDEGYIAVVPELPGCSAFGETEKEALKEIKVASSCGLKLPRKKVGKYRDLWGKRTIQGRYR